MVLNSQFLDGFSQTDNQAIVDSSDLIKLF